MIGTSSFILELMGALFPLTIFGFAVHWLWSKKQKSGYLFVALAGLMLSLMGTRYAYQLSHHLFLRGLSADEVNRIQIGDSVITKESDIRLVVAALNERQWFSSNHGGWGKTVRLEITLRNDPARAYQVGYYLKEEGAVIEFSRKWGSSRWYDGYAFSARLPEVLKQIGALLPSQN